MTYEITQPLMASVVQNLEDQLNVKKMALIALQKEINDIGALKEALLKSDREIRNTVSDLSDRP